MADYLAEELDNPHIDRRVKTGKHDRGDIAAVETMDGGRVVLECKNHKTLKLPEWWRETEQERINDNAKIGVIVHKRHGHGKPADQWVTMNLEMFAQLIKH
ncbi:hypothetical protein [Corynebacterium minutissimum]|uniref:hypothetical protein n=1 Tax=Corynebacterium minutissimum TaxID=38301 RepID=UPI001EF38C10|nr:hypothetical protein [Corynebacterium minutissimum]